MTDQDRIDHELAAKAAGYVLTWSEDNASGYGIEYVRSQQQPDHFPDAGEKVDEAAMGRLHEKGAKAWAFLGDRSASDWVDEIRGNEETCSVLIEGEAHEVSMPVAAELLRLNMLIQQRQDCEPFGYFRAESFGWTDCGPDAEGAVALYESPQVAEDCDREPVAGMVTDDMRNAVRWAASSAYWSVKLVEFFGPNARDGIAAIERQLRDALAAQLKRDPLTDEQLFASDEIMSLNADLGWHMDTIRMFARAIERAHGIGGEA